MATRRYGSLIVLMMTLVAVMAPCRAALAQQLPTTALPPGKFGEIFEGDESPFSNSRIFYRPDNYRFVEIIDGSYTAAIKGFTPVRFGPFASSPFTAVDVYLSRNGKPPDQRGIGSNGEAHPIIATRDRADRVRWWRVESDDTLYIYDEPMDDEQVDLAIEPALPLIRLRWGAVLAGANTTSEQQTQLILDLRSDPPAVLAVFEGWHLDGGGVCGAHDNSSIPRSHTTCEWNRSQSDYLCTGRLVREDTLWATREGTRRFWLSSDQLEPAPPSAQQIAQRLWQLNDTDRAEIVGVGPVRRIASGMLGNGTAYRLFAAPGMEAELDVRLVAVIQEASGAPQLVAVRHAERIAGDRYSEKTGGTFSATHESTIAAAVIAAERDTVSFKIIVREGNSRSIVIAMLSAITDSLDTVAIATDAMRYGACAAGRVPQTAVTATIQPRPLSIDIDVEPEHGSSIVDESEVAVLFEAAEPKQCDWRGKVSWTADSGFIINRTEDVCSPGARAIVIDDAGAVSWRPAFRSTSPYDEDPPVNVLAMGRGETAILFLPDPDFSAAIWEPVMSRLASSHLVATLSFGSSEPASIDHAVTRVQTAIRSLNVKHVFVVAHWLSAAYAMRWAESHPDLVAGVLIHHPEREDLTRRLHALTGTDQDRFAFAEREEPGVAAQVAPLLRNRSGHLPESHLTFLIALRDFRRGTNDKVKAPVWANGWALAPASVRDIKGPSRFAMVRDPAGFAAFVEDLIKRSAR